MNIAWVTRGWLDNVCALHNCMDIYLVAMFKCVVGCCFDNISSVFVLKWACGRKENFLGGCACVYVGEKF